MILHSTKMPDGTSHAVFVDGSEDRWVVSVDTRRRVVTRYVLERGLPKLNRDQDAAITEEVRVRSVRVTSNTPDLCRALRCPCRGR